VGDHDLDGAAHPAVRESPERPRPDHSRAGAAVAPAGGHLSDSRIDRPPWSVVATLDPWVCSGGASVRRDCHCPRPTFAARSSSSPSFGTGTARTRWTTSWTGWSRLSQAERRALGPQLQEDRYRAKCQHDSRHDQRELPAVGEGQCHEPRGGVRDVGRGGDAACASRSGGVDDAPCDVGV